MSDRPNALQMPPAPGYEDNPLMGGPSLADAWDANRQSYGDWLARDRQRQIDLGYVDPQTGQLTPAGWKAQAQIIGGGFGPADIGAVSNALGTIKAYHGSPHSFERFDMSKIGTGEGAQAYGHGLYFAENPEVAQGYRDKLAGRTTYLDDVPYDQLPKETQGLLDTLYSRPVETRIKEAEGVIPELTAKVKRGELDQWSLDSQLNYIKQLQDLKGRDISYRSPGHMYEVNLNAEPDQMLHWDKPLSEQSPHVENAVADLAAQYGIKLGNATGARVHQALADHLGASAFPELARTGSGLASDPVAAAEALRAAGIPGISYLDAGSRGGGQGTMNHVVFNDATIDILRKYGIAGLMAGGAATAFGGQDQGNQ